MKKKQVKTILATLLAIVLVGAYFPIGAFANEMEQESNGDLSKVSMMESAQEADDLDDDDMSDDDDFGDEDDEMIVEEPNDPEEPNNPTESTNYAPFEVSQSDYEKNYKNNPDYELLDTLTYYMYGTRVKSTTTSGETSLSGWTKYDSQTSESISGYKFGTPISTSTSYANNRKTVTSAVNTGWYYYAYVVANPSKPSDDWCYYADKTRAKVISHMKKNFSKSSVWDEKRLRYFWYISSSDLGATSGKLKKTIPYCADSTVSVGTLTQKGTHYYDIPMFRYNRIYKVKTVTTVNYFYKWSDYAWSDWTIAKRTIPSDGTVTEKSEVRYIVRAVDYSGETQNYKNIHECRLEISNNTVFTYNGKAATVKLGLSDNGTPLFEGKDYVVSGNGKINPGVYDVTLKGIGKYYGTGNITYTIKKANPTLYYKQSSIASVAGKTISNELVVTKGLRATVKSSNTKVATVNSNGSVIAKAAGTATITATIPASQCYNAKSTTFTLKVSAPIKATKTKAKVTSKTVKQKPPSMPGKVKTLKVKYKYGDARISWKSAKNAKKYQIRYKTKGGNWNYVTAVSNSTHIQGLAPAKKYSFQVRAINSNGSQAKASDWSKKKTKKTKSNYNIVYTYSRYKWPDSYFANGVGTPSIQYVKKGGSFKVPNGWYALRRSDGKLFDKSKGNWVTRSQALRYTPAFTFYSGHSKLTKKMLKGNKNAWFELILMN